MKARFVAHTFHFKIPAKTSRNVLYSKESYFLILEDQERMAIGECSILQGLSPDPLHEMEPQLYKVCRFLNEGSTITTDELCRFPAIGFGLEMALIDFHQGAKQLLFPSLFTEGKQGIPINGLIWMGEKYHMLDQIKKRLREGFRCLKLKVGALELETELDILKQVRRVYSANELEIRLDANGAFTPENVESNLEQLSRYHIHSIEQPIRPNQLEALKHVCYNSPIPVALDEELISCSSNALEEWLRYLKPAFIVLKPSLLGGFAASQKWIEAAERTQTGWWLTSALESNVGLNAIAQWAFTWMPTLPQGLGTGQLFKKNIPSPITMQNNLLYYNPLQSWKFNYRET